MATVQFEAIHKHYENKKVLNGIDIDVQDGEFLVLVGPSGCGKSTLLRALAGLHDVTSGNIRIDGRIVNDIPPRERDVAMVFQSYALYPHMTVEENMGFALKMAKRPAAEITQKVREASAMLGLDDLLSRLPKELSGGQRQRVAMGRAIVRRPKVFLFDEPLSNLDAKLRNQLRVELKKLHVQLATTMIYVTHDQVEAMTLADRIAVLEGGYLQQLGSPQELYDSPVNMFVGSFIGSPSMQFLHHYEPGVVVGVRPHDVLLSDEGEEAEVEAVETLGFESFVHLRLHGEALSVRVEGAPPTEKMVKVQIRHIHRFDKGTGQRI